MNINDRTLHEFGNDLREALAPLQEKYGVTISFGNINYTQERFTTKLTVTNGQSQDEAEQSAFDADVWRYGHLGLERGMFNRIFLTPDGQKMAIRGFNTRSPKYPIIALRISDGQKLRCSEGRIVELTDEYYTPSPDSGNAEAESPSPDSSKAEAKSPSPDSGKAEAAPIENTSATVAASTSLAASTAQDASKTPAQAIAPKSPIQSEQDFWNRMMEAGPGGHDQVLRDLYRQVKKVGPNDPCPCGSGKKYKKCCGR